MNDTAALNRAALNTAALDKALDICGCCDGLADPPEAKTNACGHGVRNRPGLPALGYRVGTHGAFFERMRRCLSSQPELRQLTARTLEDPSIALLDAWAVTLDVLTFYQERFANEGYLRTATERRSVLELARAIGYELDPGVAASVALAFSLETGEGAPGSARIDSGVQVLSIPGQDERPQTFETVETVKARPEWNVLVPRQNRPQDLGHGTGSMLLEGLDTRLARGDALLLVGRHRESFGGSERWDLRFITSVEPDPESQRTRVTWQPGLGHRKPWIEPADTPQVFAFRRRAALFGHNAPDWRVMPESIKREVAGIPTGDLPSQWPDFELQGVDDSRIHLDAAYPKVVVGSWLVLQKPSYVELYKISDVRTAARTDFTLTAQTSRLILNGENLRFFENSRRHTVVLAESEALSPALEPIPDAVTGRRIPLEGRIEGLEPGRRLIVRGVEAADDGTTPTVDATATAADAAAADAAATDRVAEEATLEALDDDGARSILVLEASLERAYVRSTVEIYANVALATHGETIEEALGSGDGAKPNQRFKLQRPPLTYISAATASGAQSTLEVRVNDVLWRPSPSFFGLEASTETHTARHDDDGGTTIQFGDGHHGARLPTGAENIRARYRSGIGLEGEVAADTLSLLRTRPLGVRQVTNPLAASGAADPETLAEARSNAPRTVLTLDRVVSRQDFEDFTRAFAGITKARADVLWLGERRQVELTVAAAEGKPVVAGSPLERNLLLALEAVKDPAQAVGIISYEALTFRLTARLAVDSRFLEDRVFGAVQEALGDTFAFDQRVLGQPVTASEVIATIQGVEGVVAVDLDRLERVSGPAPTGVAPPAFLAAEPARFDTRRVASLDTILPAQLLTLAEAELLPLDLLAESPR